MTEEYIAEHYGDWALTGKRGRHRNIITSLELEPHVQEERNHRLQAKYAAVKANEVRYEARMCDDADYVIVAYGCSSRICAKVIEMAREDGYKVGLLRPITLYPFPTETLRVMAEHVKGFLAVELSAGQMVEDVRLSVGSNVLVEHYGRYGGMVHSPSEVYDALKEKIISKLK